MGIKLAESLRTENAGQPEAVRCFHCGADAAGGAVEDGDKVFCCNGCYTVFNMLHQYKLEGYYDLESHPGIRREPGEEKAGQYAWLDEPSIADRLLEFSDGHTARVSFRLPDMHCAACIWLLEQLYRIQPGISSSEVNFPKREIHLRFHPETISLRQVVELLAALGYPPSLSMADAAGEKKSDKGDRRLWYELGIAGFCFGNMMLLSFPEYLSLNDVGLAMIFRYLNLVLSLPVLLYSARSYFKSAWVGLSHRKLNMDVPIAIGISVLFARSAFDILSGTGAGFLDSMAGLVFFLLLGRAYQRKTYHLLSFDRDYKSYFPIAVTRLDGDREQAVPLADLKVGDHILIRQGELIPADGRLLTGEAAIDYSFVTGEADPVPVRPGELLRAGGRQQGAPIELVLEKAPAQAYLVQLWNDRAFRKRKEAEVTELSDRVGQRFTPAVLLIALGAGIFWLLHEPSQALFIVTSVLIVACPCALALSTPFTLGNVLRILGKRGFFLKGPAVVEALALSDTVIFDKTGTLTYAQGSDVRWEGSSLEPGVRQALRGLLRGSVHPLSRRVLSWLGEGGSMPVQEFQEVTGKGLSASSDAGSLQLGSGAWLDAESGSTDGGGTSVWLRLDGHLKGRFVVANAFREGIAEAVTDLMQDHEVSLLTGDSERARAQVEAVLPAAMAKHFDQRPQDKLDQIAAQQESGKRVMMIGDGLNDAGALQQSDVGISVTEDLAAFTPASDAILQAEKLRDLPGYLRFSRASMRVIYASFGISFLYNIVGLAFAVTGNLSPLVAAILMPLSSVSVIIFTVVGTNLLARRMKI